MELSESLQAAVELISHWRLESETKLILDSGLSEQNRYLEAVDQILQSAHRNELKDVIFMVVARLKLEFRTALSMHERFSSLGVLIKKRVESIMSWGAFPEFSYSMTDSSSYGDSTGYGFSQEDNLLVEYLRKIAERMNSCGHLAACTLIYSQVRKPFVDAIIQRLKARDLKKISAEELIMITQRWIQAAKACINLLFFQENEIAELIFGGLGISTAKESFMLIVEDAVVNLFSFVEMISSSHQSSERLDIILIIYEALLSLEPGVNALFPFERIRKRLAGVRTVLQNEVMRMLSDYENALLYEKSKISNEVGHVHLLTKNVMEYINLLVSFRKHLKSLIVSKPSMTIGSLEYPDGELQDLGSLSPLSLHIVLIIAVLQLNLEDKSKKYKKASFSYMFMVTNIQFIIVSIRKSGYLKKLVGTDYLNKLTTNLERAIHELQGLMLHCLNEEDVYFSLCFCHGVSTSALMKNIKTFNGLCEDVHAFQSSLEMANSNMWEELCESNIEKLLPAYESFLKKFRGHLKSEKNTKLRILSSQKVSINYTVEELEALLRTKKFHFGGGYMVSLADII